MQGARQVGRTGHDDTMRPPARVIVAIASAAMVVGAEAACGGSATSPAGQGPQAVFPLTIARTGGIAGFQDVLVVAQDGRVSLTRRGQKTLQCRLTAAEVSRVTTAAAQVPWSRITPADTRPSFPDDMVTTVQSPAGGPARLEDPQAGGGRQVFVELLNDLTGGQAASRVCTPL